MDKSLLLDEIVDAFAGLGKNRVFENMQSSVKGEKILLVLLQKCSGFSTPGALARHLNVSPARIAAILKSLEGKNLVERIIDDEDKRRVLVKLTEEGHGIVSSIHSQMKTHAFELIERLGEKDTAEFIRILKKIAALGDGFKLDCEKDEGSVHSETDG